MIFLLTGSSGFIGNAILNNSKENGHKIYCLKRFKIISDFPIQENVINITEDELILIKDRVDVLIHAAWGGTRGQSREDVNIQELNILSLNKLLEHVKRLKINTIISFGSQAEYGNVDRIDNYTEFKPVNSYGVHKLIAKNNISRFCKENAIRFVWLRLFSIYGIGDYEHSLINTVIEKMLNNESIDLTECVQFWDYLNIKDFLDIFNVFINNRNYSGEFNIAYGKSQPLKEFIESVKRITQSKSTLNYGVIKYPEQGYANLVVDTSELTILTKWKPKTLFEDGIQEIIEYKSKIKN